MIRTLSIFSVFTLAACMGPIPQPAGPSYNFVPRPGQGQYVRPEYMNPSPTPIIPAIDACRSQLYAGLMGQHEGAIFIPGLPGRKRVIKPAEIEGFDYQPNDTFYDEPPFLQVRDFVAGQVLYAPAIQTVMDRIELLPVEEDRLTIELDREGYVQQIRCG